VIVPSFRSAARAWFHVADPNREARQFIWVEGACPARSDVGCEPSTCDRGPLRHRYLFIAAPGRSNHGSYTCSGTRPFCSTTREGRCPGFLFGLEAKIGMNTMYTMHTPFENCIRRKGVRKQTPIANQPAGELDFRNLFRTSSACRSRHRSSPGPVAGLGDPESVLMLVCILRKMCGKLDRHCC
jgi:hypothetical protein